MAKGSVSTLCCRPWQAGADAAVEEATRQLAQKYRRDPIKARQEEKVFAHGSDDVGQCGAQSFHLGCQELRAGHVLTEAFALHDSEASDFFAAWPRVPCVFARFQGRLSSKKVTLQGVFSELHALCLQVHNGPMRFAELDSFVDGVLNGGPLEQKMQAGKSFKLSFQ